VIDQNAACVWFDVTDSTNEAAARLVRSGAWAPCWLEAGVQTAGRGRRGRAWLSQPGNVFMTYLGATDRPLADIALLGFAAAVAVADVVDQQAGRAVTALKWPNDVLIDGAKLCGILLESGALEAGRWWFALGIGVNVVSAPEGLDTPIASLRAQAIAADAGAVRAAIRRATAQAAHALIIDGFSSIRARWLARAYGLGRPVRAQLGAETIAGLALDLAPDGALTIETPDGRIRSISAGEVYFSA
jgi:BirA family biotin operon repressor/biotin-[acetyl-CoA-carboxylase] ligase